MRKKRKQSSEGQRKEPADTLDVRQPSERKGTLVEFFARSPLRGSGLKIERIRGGFRKVDFD
jgi:hypothetical protein